MNRSLVTRLEKLEAKQKGDAQNALLAFGEEEARRLEAENPGATVIQVSFVAPDTKRALLRGD
jgi:hypothetical protein